MIAITGAAGFIASFLVQYLNEQGHFDLILVDNFDRTDKNKNIENSIFSKKIDRSLFLAWFAKNANEVNFVFHLGARTDTTEMDKSIFDELNLHYSQELWKICAKNNISLVYASSAATYGAGELGYDDNHAIIPKLRPLNPYGESKNEFDKWVLRRRHFPDFWAGLKFFNVYGANEYHKGRMASVVFHTFRQIRATGAMKLFRSHRPNIKDGEQMRDFIYVKDVVKIIYFLYKNRPKSAIYNVGTGKARTFLDLAIHTFEALGLSPNIHFIDTPADIRANYQYFTEANMQKLRQTAYDEPFYALEEGIADYVKNYLNI